MRRFGIVVVALAAAAAFVAGGWASADESHPLVLKGGKTLQVSKTVVRNGMVLVTFADGRMQGYQLGDVDLAASGLVPSKKPAQEVRTQSTPKLSLAQRATAARFQITDADVEHVERPVPGQVATATGSKKQAPAASLQVSNLRQEISKGILKLSGTIQNTGANPVSSITVEAVAMDAGGKSSGRGTTVVSQQLAPKGSAPFSMSFPVSGPVYNVRVRALASVASFDLGKVPAPAGGKEKSGAAE